jgi:hypothetical protein
LLLLLLLLPLLPLLLGCTFPLLLGRAFALLFRRAFALLFSRRRSTFRRRSLTFPLLLELLRRRLPESWYAPKAQYHAQRHPQNHNLRPSHSLDFHFVLPIALIGHSFSPHLDPHCYCCH